MAEKCNSRKKKKSSPHNDVFSFLPSFMEFFFSTILLQRKCSKQIEKEIIQKQWSLLCYINLNLLLMFLSSDKSEIRLCLDLSCLQFSQSDALFLNVSELMTCLFVSQ